MTRLAKQTVLWGAQRRNGGDDGAVPSTLSLFSFDNGNLDTPTMYTNERQQENRMINGSQ